VTVPGEAAEGFAREAARYAALPDNSVQNPILGFAPHDIVALATRLRPFLGQIGTSPSATIPDSHNAGDFGSFLVGAPHIYAMTPQELELHKTDGHMDVDAVRAGAILVCPVKLDGGGVYLGDMHALQGDGEIAGHTCDVSGTVTLEVEVMKKLGIDGPVLFPLEEDLPYLAQPLSADERARALALGRRHGVQELERSMPISVIGSGPDLNSATDNGLARAAELLDMTVPEVKNRATIAGAIEIGRHPGVVQVTFRAPADRLEARGLLGYAVEQYGQV
jgi:formamidase